MFEYWSMARIKHLAMTFYLNTSRTWRVQIQVFLPFCWFFFQEALWRLDNRLVSMGKATMGMTGKFLFFFWDDGSQVPMVNSGGWRESVLDKKTYGKYHEWPWYNMVSFHWTTVSCVDSCPVLMVQGISGMWQIASIGSALIQQKRQNSRFWVGWESLDLGGLRSIR